MTTDTDRYPTDAMNTAGTAGIDDEMMDPLEETEVEVVFLGDTEADAAGPDDDREQTRARMADTVDAIQSKLQPQTLAEQAKAAISDVGSHAKETLSDVASTAVHGVVDPVKDAYRGVVDPVKQTVGGAVDTARGAGTTLSQVVRDNPIPVGMACVGLFWLYRNVQSRPATMAAAQPTPVQSDVSSTIADAASRVKEQAGQVAHTVQQKAQDLAGSAQSKLGVAGDKAQQTIRSSADRVQSYQMEAPLALAGAALITGAMIGMMLPSTPVEDRAMGQARDRLVDTVAEKAQDVTQKVGAVAQQAADAATNTAKQEAQNQGLTPTPDQSQPFA